MYIPYTALLFCHFYGCYFVMPELNYMPICQNIKIWWQNTDFVTAMQNEQGAPCVLSGGSLPPFTYRWSEVSF